MKINSLLRSATILTAVLLLIAHHSLLAHERTAGSPLAIEEPPVLGNIEQDDLIYSKGSGPVQVTQTLTVTDVDSRYLYLATIRIVDGYNASEDILRYTGKISGTWNSKTGTLSLSGRATVSDYQNALRSIRYENTNIINPSTRRRSVSFSVGSYFETSNTVSRNITVLAKNSPPVLNHIETTPVNYCINQESTVITNSIAVSDIDNNTLNRALIAITDGYVPLEDLLVFNDQNGITGSWDPVSGNLLLSGISLLANYQQALRSIRYANTNSKEPTAGNRKISFVADDGTDKSNEVSRTVLVHERVTGVLTGNTTICKDDNASIPLQISFKGTPPWEVEISRNGIRETSYSNIMVNPYTFFVRKEGTYRIASVSDNYCNGDTSGSGYARVLINELPTAVISGSDSICENTTTDLHITLTGTPPWRFTYRRDSNNPVEVNNVLLSPDLIAVSEKGTYTLVELYDKNCKGLVTGSAVITLKPVPVVSMSGPDPAYNRDSTIWVPLTGTPAGGSFSGPGVIQYNNKWFFVTSLPPIGTHNIVYAWRESQASCYGFDTVVVQILEADALIEFENNRTNYCQNDASFVVSGANVSGTTGSFSISGGAGLTDNGNNTATVHPDALSVNKYTITYTYVEFGQPLSVSADFFIGNKAIANFKWPTECYQAGQAVNLINTSTPGFGFLTDTSYMWKVYTQGDCDTFNTRNIQYIFPESGSYTIALQIVNNYGCRHDTSKVFALRPTVAVFDTSYFETFETGAIGWQTGNSDAVSMNSWQFGTPSKHGNPPRGFSGASSGQNCWFTHLPSNTAPREQSYVTSPCFDFTGINRPMLKMDIWRLFTDARDGANIQATVDSGKTWIPVGEINDGINWFNAYFGNPGQQSVGWTNLRDGGWVREARHSLDFLKEYSKVQFRIAYTAAGTAIGNDGIAFDNFWIGERNRVAIIEHFTNASEMNCLHADSILDHYAGNNKLSVIDIQYHTGNPAGDPFYEDNPVIPATREFYYGLSGVPFGLLNGGSSSMHRFDYDPESKPLDKNAVVVESLHESLFGINISSEFTENNMLQAEVEFFAMKDIPATGISVRLAVIERVISGISCQNGDTLFRNVVKAMLPDAAGTTFNKAWYQGDHSKIFLNWPMQHVYNPLELRLVAFIQNESTSEIYQASLNTIVGTTGVDSRFGGKLPDENMFRVYPNPASRLTSITFNPETRSELTLELFNNVGRMVYSTNIPTGTGKQEIPVDELPEGLYMIRLFTGQTVAGTGKLIILGK
ncbi:MAG: T9SS type A sorting domain-containing protein [Bacteroidales bacterium]|nr:T9SS type A sorting domain-containing protein [Bacteroidales bacterium]